MHLITRGKTKLVGACSTTNHCYYTKNYLTRFLAIRKLCTVRSDLSKIPRHQFPVVENCLGLRFYRVLFDLRLSILGEVLNFELLHEGKQCGKVTAKFE